MMKKNIVSNISVVLSIRLVMLKSKLLQQYNACPLNLRTFSLLNIYTICNVILMFPISYT